MSSSATPSQQRGSGGPYSHASISPSIGGSKDYGGNRYGIQYVTGAYPQTSLIYPPSITTPVCAGPNPIDSAFEVPRTPGNLQLYVVTDGLTSNAHHLDSNPPELHLDASLSERRRKLDKGKYYVYPMLPRLVLLWRF